MLVILHFTHNLYIFIFIPGNVLIGWSTSHFSEELCFVIDFELVWLQLWPHTDLLTTFLIANIPNCALLKPIMIKLWKCCISNFKHKIFLKPTLIASLNNGGVLLANWHTVLMALKYLIFLHLKINLFVQCITNYTQMKGLFCLLCFCLFVFFSFVNKNAILMENESTPICRRNCSSVVLSISAGED